MPTPVVLVCLLAAVLSGCGGEKAVDPSSVDDLPRSDSSYFTEADCQALIPSEVLTGLGWAASGGVTTTATRCEQAADSGTVIVQRDTYVSTGGDDSALAKETFDESCTSLGTAGSTVENPSGSITGDFTACATTGSTSAVAKAVVLNSQQQVATIMVAVSQDTDPAKVQTALGQLATAVATDLEPIGS